MLSNEKGKLPLNQNEKIATVAVTVFAVTSVIFLIIGVFCGHLRICQKNRLFADTASSQPRNKITSQSHELELELKENESYVPVHSLVQ